MANTVAQQRSPGRRGRYAESPRQIPAQGWRDVGKRVVDEMGQDHLSIVAAGVALYWFLALLPTLIALFSVYGLVADPAQVEQQIQSLASILPEATQGFLRQQMERLAGQQTGSLGLGLGIGILGALWSASKGVRAMMESLNIVYDESEGRSFLNKYLVALGLTALLILMAVVAIGVIALLPLAMSWLGLGAGIGLLINLLKWPLLLAFVVLVLALLYRWAPAREGAKWRWVTPGSIIASLLWLIGSWAFSVFIQNFTSYANTYGSLAAVIILILWLNLSAYIVLLGGEINAELERQTSRDSTAGPDKAMGERGAYVADTVAEASADKPRRGSGSA